VLIVPAVDLLDGCVVRVEQGDQNRKKVYSNDPVSVVRDFARNGAVLIHVVDLNAAIRNDHETNKDVVAKILSEEQSVGIEMAGGIRNSKTVEALLKNGAKRVVISSLAYSNPDEAYKILHSLGPESIVLALDYDGESRIRTSGWKVQRSETVYDAVSRFSRIGFNYFLTTAVQRDGLLKGPDVETLAKLRKSNPKGSARLIASGGVSDEQDLVALSSLGMDEVIVGKALYEGRISLSTLSKFKDV
jgi:phosphoribosylformimino-5-aminoimidazole carboxamide ribotide isomerase